MHVVPAQGAMAVIVPRPYEVLAECGQELARPVKLETGVYQCIGRGVA